MRARKPNNKDSEEVVTVRLEKWQIPYLIGAARLGIWCEGWCAAYLQTSIGTYDTHSGRWILTIGYLIDLIKKQTGVTNEDKEYGLDSALEVIQELVDKQCQQNIEQLDKWEQEENERNTQQEGIPEQIKAEKR